MHIRLCPPILRIKGYSYNLQAGGRQATGLGLCSTTTAATITMTIQKVNVLNTGANQGIGFGLASLLARSTSPAYHILLCSRNLSKGQAAAASLSNLPGTVEALELDVTSAASVGTAGQYVSQALPCLDVLINNAGIAIYNEVAKDRVVLPEALRPVLRNQQ